MKANFHESRNRHFMLPSVLALQLQQGDENFLHTTLSMTPLLHGMLVRFPEIDNPVSA